jgi:VWFA-related protein
MAWVQKGSLACLSAGGGRPGGLPYIAAILLAFTLAGAQQPPPRQDGVVPNFSTKVAFVIEDVSVTDKNGKPVEGLRPEDFVVTEDKVPQTIRLFEYQKLDDVPLAELERRPDSAPAPAPPAVPAPAPPPAAVGAPAQIAAEKPGDFLYRNRRLLVFYFDLSAMQVPDQLRALDAARKFVNTQITAADRVAIMEYSEGAIKVRQDFTGDRDQLRSTIEKIAVAAEGLDENADDASTPDTGAAFGQDDSEFNIFNTDRQMAALQTAVEMLGRLAEKKALIYFASGMTLNGVDNQAQLRATENAAIRANVAFWTIDARGLVASAPMGDATRGSPGGSGAYTGAGAMAMASSLQRSQDALYAIATDTGGKAMFDNNDLALGIVNAQKAMSSYYVIGYYSTNGALDGKFRRVAITLKEFPSAKLDFRQGYLAGKEFGKFNAADKERQLEDALMLEDPITDLTIAMEVNYFQLNRAEYYVPVVMKIPGSELARARRGGAERTHIDFIGEIKNEYGSTIQNIRDKVDMELSGSTAAELVKQQIQYDTGYTLLPGSYTIKVLARDDETGRIGTYISKFVIPNLNKETQRIPISSVVLSSQRIELKDALFTAGKDKAQISNPLVQDGQKTIPSVTRVFSRSRDMYVYLQAYEPNAETLQPLVAFVTFYRGQARVFETAPLPVAEGLSNKLKTVPLKFSIAMSKLPPGKYTCQVSVLDPKDQKAAFWQAPIMVAP